jgi:adenylosuccinate lyase
LIFSGQLLLDLAAAGLLREDAYRLVQGHAMQAWRTDGDFRLSIQEDATVSRYLNEAQLAHAFSLDRQLKNVHAIFDRVFRQAS